MEDNKSPVEPTQTVTDPVSNNATDSPESSQAVSVEPKKSHAKKIILIVLGVVTLIIILAVLFVVFVFGAINNVTAAPLSASDSFIKSLQKKDVQAAYAKTSKAFQAAEDQIQFSDFVEQYNAEISPSYTVVINKSVNSNEKGAQTATIIYNVQDKDTAKNEYMRIVLEQESGTWKIRNVEYQPKPFEEQ